MYTRYVTEVLDDGNTRVNQTNHTFIQEPIKTEKLGVMLVGLGGNNGTTFTAGIEAQRQGLQWETVSGEHSIEFLGSISQMGSVHIGYDSYGKSHSRLFKDIALMHKPEDLVIGGWDICGDDLHTAAKKARVINPELLRKLETSLSSIVPLPSIFDPNFLASNQSERANNVLNYSSKGLLVEQIKSNIADFKNLHNLTKVVVLWTASTERFNQGNWTDAKELLAAVQKNDPEVSPSVLFAIAAIESECIYLNGSPQNTIIPAVIDLAKEYHTFLGGEDFKTGQTKLKSALVDWLACSGIRPLSIVSYNHLGNNDGKNLSEEPQFRSKEITKKNVIDDVVEANPVLFPDGKPDHAVVIKYIPAVGDSKRAIDEYYSQIFMDGRHNIVIHNTCEDSLLAAPLMLDIILFAELFSRISVVTHKGEQVTRSMHTVLSLLSLFFKAPAVNQGEPTINAFFRQRHGLENFFRVLGGLPPLDHIP